MSKTNQKSFNIQTILYAFLILLMVIGAGAGLDYFLGKSSFDLLKNMLLMICPMVVLCFVYSYDRQKKLLDYYESNKNYRFYIAFVACFIFLIAGSFTSMDVFPFSVVAIPLLLFGNTSCAYIGYISYLLFLFLHFDISTPQMFYLLFSGFVGIALFSKLGDRFHYVGCFIGYLVTVFISKAFLVILSGETVDKLTTGDQLLNLGILLFLNVILLLLILKLFSVVCVYKQSDLFDEINDPEYSLLTKLKEVNKDAYFHAVHTAYLSDKIARKIGADSRLAKSIGYYHKIGLLQGKDNLQNTILVATANDLPTELVYELKRYGVKNVENLSKENAIAQLADAVVTSITYLFVKDKNIIIDYKKVVSVIIQKKIDCHDFDHCQLTIEDLTTIRNGFVEERLYYDFLR